MRLQKKKSISDSRAAPKRLFFTIRLALKKKLYSVRRLLDGEVGSERMKKRKGCLFKRNSLCVVAEARLELTTFGL